MSRLADKVVIVAGAAGAQGLEICRRMLSAGAKLVVGDVAGDEHSTRSALDHDGDALEYVSLDVTSPQAWQNAVSVAETEFGCLDGLVDAAAVLSREGVESATVENWHRILDVNVIGAWLGIQNSIPALRRAGRGSIVLISSIDSLIGRGGAVSYHASKGALRQMARTTAIELAPDQIRVNTVCPGVMSNSMKMVIDSESPKPDNMHKTPLGRTGTPEDIAWAVVYLMSDESGFVTGTDLVVDGGYTAQ